MDNLLIAYAGKYADASLAFYAARMALLQFAFVGVSALFAFWFSIGDAERRSRLFWPVAIGALTAAFFAAFLVYVASKDAKTHWIMFDKVMRQAQDVIADGEATDGEFYKRKFKEADAQFGEINLWSRFLVWRLPIVVYAAILSLVAGLIHFKRMPAKDRRPQDRQNS